MGFSDDLCCYGPGEVTTNTPMWVMYLLILSIPVLILLMLVHLDSIKLIIRRGLGMVEHIPLQNPPFIEKNGDQSAWFEEVYGRATDALVLGMYTIQSSERKVTNHSVVKVREFFDSGGRCILHLRLEIPLFKNKLIPSRAKLFVGFDYRSSLVNLLVDDGWSKEVSPQLAKSTRNMLVNLWNSQEEFTSTERIYVSG